MRIGKIAKARAPTIAAILGEVEDNDRAFQIFLNVRFQ